MTKRPSGWYWIKDDPTDDWQVAEWDIDGGYLWIIDGASRRADPDIIGPRISSPDEVVDAVAQERERLIRAVEAWDAIGHRWHGMPYDPMTIKKRMLAAISDNT